MPIVGKIDLIRAEIVGRKIKQSVLAARRNAEADESRRITENAASRRVWESVFSAVNPPRS